MTMGCEEDEGVFIMSSSVANGTGTLSFCDVHRHIYVYLHYSVTRFPLLVSNDRLISQDDENSKEKVYRGYGLDLQPKTIAVVFNAGTIDDAGGTPGVRSESRKATAECLPHENPLHDLLFSI